MLVLLTIVLLLAATGVLIALDRDPASPRQETRLPTVPEARSRARSFRTHAAGELQATYRHVTRQAHGVRRRLRSSSGHAPADTPVP